MSFLPPNTITLGGTWGNDGYVYSHTTNGFYNLIHSNGTILSGQSIEFTDNSGELTLDVNPSTSGGQVPSFFNSSLTSGVVAFGDSISLKNSSGVTKATFTCPDFYTGTSGSGGGTGASATTTPKKVFSNFW